MDTHTGHRKDVISILVLLVLLALPASAVTPTATEVTEEKYDINFPDSLYMALNGTSPIKLKVKEVKALRKGIK